jgi:uncharacterized protein YidB (DUF937 family)
MTRASAGEHETRIRCEGAWADNQTKEKAMGLFESVSDTLKDVFGQVDAKTAPGLISAMLAKTGLGDLQGIVSKLEAAGFSDQVRSWLGDGANLPISAEQLRTALGNEQVQQIARQLNLPIDDAMKFLAEHVPNAVDQASPNGSLSASS